jgi:hypothetical protein
MKRAFIFCWLLFFLGVKITAQQTRILFLGNSYTYVNDLPGTLSQLSLSMGDSIYYEVNAPGGFMLIQHASDPTSLQKINAGGWDYVVVQAQSEEPALDSNAFYYQTYPYARKLDSLIHSVSPCAITLFYMTWGRKYGDSYWCPVNPPMCTFLGMNGKLRERYLEMAGDNFSRVAPVGVAWKNSWFADSTINLWSGDNSHPTMAGTYLAANVFYSSIFKQSPIGSIYTAGLPPAQANFLQAIGSHTVLDSIDTWMLEQVPINASFTDTINQSAVNFYSTSYNTTQFWWDFGDGLGYSSLENSNYFYSTPGTYQVELVAYNACYSDTITADVTIASIGIENELLDEFHVFPNPTGSSLFFTEDLNERQFQLINMQGKVVLQGSISANRIDVSQLSKGIYFLKINNRTNKIVVE